MHDPKLVQTLFKQHPEAALLPDDEGFTPSALLRQNGGEQSEMAIHLENAAESWWENREKREQAKQQAEKRRAHKAQLATKPVKTEKEAAEMGFTTDQLLSMQFVFSVIDKDGEGAVERDDCIAFCAGSSEEVGKMTPSAVPSDGHTITKLFKRPCDLVPGGQEAISEIV